MGVRFSAAIQNGSKAHPTSCTMGARCLSGVKAADAWNQSSIEARERILL